MLKLAATIILMIGSIGLSNFFCMEQRRKKNHLCYMRYIMLFMENEISYGRSSFPEICANISQWVKEPYQTFFNEIVKRVEKRDGRRFQEIWEGQVEILRKDLSLSKKEMEHFTSYPDSKGYENTEMQVRTMKRKMELIDTAIQEAEQKIKKNESVYRCIGVAGGLFFCIIFW